MRPYGPYVVLNAASVASDQTSSNFQLMQMFGASASCVVAGGGNNAAGTLTINGSVDGVNFTPLQNAGVNMTLTVSGNGTYIFDVPETQLQYLNVSYAHASGTGTLTITVYSKGF